MSNQIQPILLMNAQTRSEVGGELLIGLDQWALEQIDIWWGIYFDAAEYEIDMRGLPTEILPDSRGWQWRHKRNIVGGNYLEFFGVRYRRALQGVLAISTQEYICAAEPHNGKSALCIEYLAAAPWNLADFMRTLGRPPFLREIGLTLMRVAVNASVQSGHEGRLCLFAVPKAYRFYRDKCGMIDLGEEMHGGEPLQRFEMTAEQAREFARRR